MATILRIAALQHEDPEANMNRLWVGLLRQMGQSGNYQFVSFYGRYGTTLSRTTYRASEYHEEDALVEYQAAYREKLAHGYLSVDFRESRYRMLEQIHNLGTIVAGTTTTDTQFDRLPAVPRETPTWDAVEPRSRGVPIVPTPTPQIDPAVHQTILNLSLRLPPSERAAWIADQIRQAAEFEATLNALKRELHKSDGRPDLMPRVRQARRVNFQGKRLA